MTTLIMLSKCRIIMVSCRIKRVKCRIPLARSRIPRAKCRNIHEGSFWLSARSWFLKANPTENVSFASANDTNYSLSNYVENVTTWIMFAKCRIIVVSCRINCVKCWIPLARSRIPRAKCRNIQEGSIWLSARCLFLKGKPNRKRDYLNYVCEV